jgi:Tfp pilus assembly protein PilP
MKFWMISICLALIKPALADISDLEAYVNELNQTAHGVMLPKLPEYRLANTNYVPVDMRNIFVNHLAISQAEQSYLQKYNLNQLQMVGYMHYGTMDYAFLRTPYETIRAKIGEHIQDGVVTKITPTNVEIDQTLVQSGKSYTKKIYLQLLEKKDKTLGKLP